MILLGKTYGNLMVDMAPTNSKLRGRAHALLEEATGADPLECAAAFSAADGNVKVALVTLLADVDAVRASQALDTVDGHVKQALKQLATDRHERTDSGRKEET